MQHQPGRRVFDGQAESLHLRTRDPHAALAELYARDRQHVFLEGGPTLAAAFLRAGFVPVKLGPRVLRTETAALAALAALNALAGDF